MKDKPAGWKPIPKTVDQMKFEKQREGNTIDQNVLELMYLTEKSNDYLKKASFSLKVIMWIAIIYVIASVIVGTWSFFKY